MKQTPDHKKMETKLRNAGGLSFFEWVRLMGLRKNHAENQKQLKDEIDGLNNGTLSVFKT